MRTHRSLLAFIAVAVWGAAAAAAQELPFVDVPGKAEIKQFFADHREHAHAGQVYIGRQAVGDGAWVRVTLQCEADGAEVTRDFAAATTWIVSADGRRAERILSAAGATGVTLVMGRDTEAAALRNALEGRQDDAAAALKDGAR